ncbi:MAG TPA: hypothetical protein VIT20_11225 [Propionibacteriaceae bacterium]
MYAREPLPESILAAARRQDGMLSRGQLVGASLTDGQVARLVRGQVLTRVDQGLYLIGLTEMTWRRYAWGAVLLGGRQSRLMGRTAGALEGLCPEIMPVEVLVPSAMGVRTRPWVRVHREQTGARSSGRVGAPARTLVEDTVLDLCASTGDEGAVIGFLTAASQRLTTAGRIRSALNRRTRVRHRRLIEAILTDVSEGVRSPLELRWIRDVERAHGLPRAVRPYRLPSGEVADGAWEEFKVLLELDGRAYHDGELRFRDWRRDNRGGEDGWLTLRYGWHDTVVESCLAAGNAARVLTRRGWNGRPHSCPRCN